MKSLKDFLNEMLESNEQVIEEGKETIKSEKDFREAARAKFEEVFGDELDEDKMNETIDGILKDNADLVEKEDWAELIGILNQSFAPESTNESIIKEYKNPRDDFRVKKPFPMKDCMWENYDAVDGGTDDPEYLQKINNEFGFDEFIEYANKNKWKKDKEGYHIIPKGTELSFSGYV